MYEKAQKGSSSDLRSPRLKTLREPCHASNKEASRTDSPESNELRYKKLLQTDEKE